MNITGRLRAALLVGILLGSVVLVAQPAAAGAPITPLGATLEGGTVGTQRDCDGNTVVAGTSITLDIERTDDSTAAVQYDLTWSGTLVAGVDFEAPPTSGNIVAGEHHAERVRLKPLTDEEGTIAVDVTGPGIAPFHVESTRRHQDLPNCALLDTVFATGTVGVPISVPIGDIAPFADSPDVLLIPFGDVVPGTSVTAEADPADRKIMGTPTIAGTYTYSLRAFSVFGYQIASQTFVIEVLPAEDTATTTLPTPGPSGTGTTTGSSGAATPVTAVAVFTG